MQSNFGANLYNIIQIIWHDLGQSLGCYGAPSIKSPVLDRMAAEGVLCENAFCTAPLCSPSRAAISTGRYPHANGVMGLTHRGWCLHDDEVTLPHYFNQVGYDTFLFGFQHEVHANRDGEGAKVIADRLGYLHVWNESLGSQAVAERVCRFLQEEIPAQPFFASVGFSDVHRPNSNTVVSREQLASVKLPPYLPDDPAVKMDYAQFAEKIRIADQAVGQILDCLRVQGLHQKTLVFFTTDHGPDYPRAKSSLYDPGIKVALIFWGPDFISTGKRLRSLISNVDLLPTLLDLLGVPIPQNVHGKSFLPVLLGHKDQHREFILAERTWHGDYDPIRAIRTLDYKYIYNFRPGWPVMVPPEYALRVGVEKTERDFGVPRPEQELYDLAADPDEKRNLANDRRYDDLRVKLYEKLMAELLATQDPLLEGDIPHPGKAGSGCSWVKEGDTFKLHFYGSWGKAAKPVEYGG
jgi:N-sulfoglucosamine sulfohydrolase